ncbi:MAG: hypothetical protein JSR25_13400 [Proteobacteria bacterium]|nr:hypothetical protein [Pseudomonadota bacterium]
MAASLLLLPAAASAAPEDELAAMEKTLSRDVRAFIERKIECNHWAGEEPYDAARARQIERAVQHLKCEALDKDEVALKRRHAGDERALKGFALADEVYR